VRGKYGRAPVQPSISTRAGRADVRRVSVGAVYEGCIPQAPGVQSRSAPFGSDESVHAAPQSFIQRPVKQMRLATTGGFKIGSQIGHRRSQN
jgi:hypothetical protein